MITSQKDEKTGLTNIYRNDQILLCPFRNPIALPGQLAGQISIMNNPCNSLCPFFTDNENGSITLKCKDVTLFANDKKEDKKPPMIVL